MNRWLSFLTKDEEELRLDWTNTEQHHHPHNHKHQHHNPPTDHHHQQQRQAAGHTGPRPNRSRQQREPRARLPEPPGSQPQPSPRKPAQVGRGDGPQTGNTSSQAPRCQGTTRGTLQHLTPHFYTCRPFRALDTPSTTTKSSRLLFLSRGRKVPCEETDIYMSGGLILPGSFFTVLAFLFQWGTGRQPNLFYTNNLSNLVCGFCLYSLSNLFIFQDWTSDQPNITFIFISVLTHSFSHNDKLQQLGSFYSVASQI